MVQQIRRFATSIAANISEGAERRGPKEFLQFIGIANGSPAETKTYLAIARRLSYLDAGKTFELEESAREIRMMLAGLNRALRATVDRRPSPEQPLTTEH